jgi:hypothetical protein
VFWECGGVPPLLKSILKSKIVVFRDPSGHSYRMPEPATSWPHAPKHQLLEDGAYFVTASTYLKAHHFRTPQRLDVLQRGLLTVARDFCWELEAWAVFRIIITSLLIPGILQESQAACRKCWAYFTAGRLAGSIG